MMPESTPPTNTKAAVKISIPAIDQTEYRVEIGRGNLSALGDTARQVLGERPRRAFILVDDKLSPTSVASATLSLEAAGFEVTTFEIVADERKKSLDTHRDALRALAETGAERIEPVVALGGGITGDIGGFVAATYRRGVPVIQCPTTLLAMVDASVGGKTGVNIETRHGLIKNAAGAFHQPIAVVADVGTLSSLPDRELRAGLAECLKHGLLSAGFRTEDNLFPWTTSHAEQFINRDRSMLVELVTRNVRVKSAVVRQDPLETSTISGRSRQLLNLGHTFAHAIETVPGLASSITGDPDATLLHGEAVGLGLVAAAAAACKIQSITPTHAQIIRDAVQSIGIPTRVPNLPSNDELLDRMMLDKKVSGGRLTLVVPTTSLIPASEESSLGMAMLVPSPPTTVVQAGLDAIRG